jgi:hydroxymethylglutaryl-CoA lyase
MPSDQKIAADSRRRAFIQEVALRDGFQSEASFVPTDQKIALANALSRTGLAKLEVTSFVSPKAIPALRDAEDVMQGIERLPGVLYTVLVPNLRGAERALACRADEWNLVMSVSETHNLMNLRMTREQSFRQLAEVVTFARSAVPSVQINVSLSCSFGCPVEGDVPAAETHRWIARFLDLAGVHGVSICDTTGMAYPTQVRAICAEHRRRWPDSETTLHFHNTRGMGLANVMAGLEAGIDRFDASLGGLGGCPYAPGATGNICTEDLVHMLELSGCDTGVDLDALLACARKLPAIVGHDTPGQVVKAGRSSETHPAPDWLEETRARALARA